MQRFERGDGVTSESSGSRVVILDAAGETLTTLNPTGAVVWDAFSEPRSLDEVMARLQREYPEVDPDVLRDDGARFVGDLRSAGLIVVADAAG